MRILYHHRTQSEDAQGIHINEMVKAFRDLGHEVEMASLVKPDGENKLSKTRWKWLMSWAHSSWFYELMSLVYNLYGYLTLYRKIKATAPDLIYERYSLNTFCGIWASRHFRVPIVLEVNSPLFYERSVENLTFKRLLQSSERWICSNSTWTIVVSKAMKDFLTQQGVPGHKIIVMSNGIDSREFHPRSPSRTLLRRYGIENRRVIGFVGWFRQWHGLRMLLEIMCETHLATTDARLLLVGTGPAHPDLHQYAQEHNLGSAVIFTGAIPREEIPDHIAAMDITVLPQTPEYSCPMKVLEYMAMGRCIIAPDQPNIRELLQDGITGRLFRPEDRTHFKKVLLDTLQDSAGQHDLGRNAYNTIHDRQYLWIGNAKKTIDLVFQNGTRRDSQIGNLSLAHQE